MPNDGAASGEGTGCPYSDVGRGKPGEASSWYTPAPATDGCGGLTVQWSPHTHGGSGVGPARGLRWSQDDNGAERS